MINLGLLIFLTTKELVMENVFLAFQKPNETNETKRIQIEVKESYFERRRTHLKTVCEEVKTSGENLPLPMPNSWFAFPSNLLVLKERNLVWCPVYKAATSTWMSYLVQFSSLTPDEKKRKLNKLRAIDLGRSVAPRLSQKAWNEWLRNAHHTVLVKLFENLENISATDSLIGLK